MKRLNFRPLSILLGCLVIASPFALSILLEYFMNASPADDSILEWEEPCERVSEEFLVDYTSEKFHLLKGKHSTELYLNAKDVADCGIEEVIRLKDTTGKIKIP